MHFALTFDFTKFPYWERHAELTHDDRILLIWTSSIQANRDRKANDSQASIVGHVTNVAQILDSSSTPCILETLSSV
jgi:hypothetical protein